jgi:hypothetical protein
MPNSLTTLEDYQDFLDYLYLIGSESTTEEELNRLYNEKVHIEFDGHTLHIPFDAVIYNSLVSLVETIIKEY